LATVTSRYGVKHLRSSS